jgi:hypothetical protein
MKKNVPVIQDRIIPADLVPIFNPPPLLSSEDPKVYCRILVGLAEDLQPVTVTEWLLVKDITDLNWEMRRMRRWKSAVLEATRTVEPDRTTDHNVSAIRAEQNTRILPAMRRVVSEYASARGESIPPAPPEPPPPKKRARRQKKTQQQIDAATAQVFRDNIDFCDAVERQMATMEARRAGLYRELELYREGRALRRPSNPILDAEFSEAPRRLALEQGDPTGHPIDGAEADIPVTETHRTNDNDSIAQDQSQSG